MFTYNYEEGKKKIQKMKPEEKKKWAFTGAVRSKILKTESFPDTTIVNEVTDAKFQMEDDGWCIGLKTSAGWQ